MKRSRLGYFAMGAVVTLAICLAAVPVFGAAVSRQLTAMYSGIKLYVDGALIVPKDALGNAVEPFIVDGTTYLPVRAVGEALGRTVTWDDATQSVYLGGTPGGAERVNTPAPAGGFDEAQVISQLKPTVHVFRDDWSDYVFLEIANNSAYDLGISADVSFLGQNNNLVGVGNASEPIVGSGTTTLLTFTPDQDFNTVSYELSVDTDTYYEPVVADLKYESVKGIEKEIVSVTNEGDVAAGFVECNVLFFASGEVVGHDWAYFTDDDSEIKPGRTERREMNCSEPYDSFKVYLSGQAEI